MRVFEFIVVPKTPFKFNDVAIAALSGNPNKSIGLIRFFDKDNIGVTPNSQIRIFTAFTDEARLGFQTFVPSIFFDTQSVFADTIATNDTIQNQLYFYKN